MVAVYPLRASRAETMLRTGASSSTTRILACDIGLRLHGADALWRSYRLDFFGLDGLGGFGGFLKGFGWNGVFVGGVLWTGCGGLCGECGWRIARF